MRRELEHFHIGNSYGGNQDWFRTFMMRIGGCGAETACDSSIYFALRRGIEDAYPFDLENLTRQDYVEFAHMMEKYLWPRMMGIDKLEIYIDGYGKYLRDRGITDIRMSMLEGSASYEEAERVLMRQIDEGYPVPMLVLNHKNKRYKDYVWHWFLINGYEKDEGSDFVWVKVVNYSMWEWFNLRELWETGYSHKGGFVVYNLA